MASIWLAMKMDRSPSKAVGRIPLTEAKKRMTSIADNWASCGPGRALEVISGLEIHLLTYDLPRFNCAGETKVSKPNVVGHLWVEPCSPPSVPAGGDIYRSTKA